MAPNEWTKRVTGAATLREARRYVRNQSNPEAASELFAALVAAIGSDFQAARRLAAAGQSLETPGSEKWVYRFRAVAHRLEGKWIRAARAFVAAGEAAGPEDQAEFSLGAIDSLARAGQPDQARAIGESLYENCAPGNHAVLAKIALNTGHALSWFDLLDESVVWYRRAVDHAEQAGKPLEHAMALVGLSTSQLGRGDADAAIGPAEVAREVFQSLGHSGYAATATMNIAEAERDRGAFDRALSLLLECRDQFDPDEEEAFRVKHDLAGVYLAMNLWVEAEDCYLAALAKPWARSMPVHRAGCWQGIAEARRQLGRRQAAKEAANRARRLYAQYGDRVWEASAYRQWVELIDRPTRRHVTQLQLQAELLRKRGFLLHLAEHELCLAKLGDERALESAGKLISRIGLSHREWELHFLRAQAAKGKRRRRHFQTMMECIWRERQMLESRNALVAYLHDKTIAVQSYIGELLSSGDQSDVQIAFETISESRSVALIDEILGAEKALDSSVAQELDELRREITRAEAMVNDPEGRRRRLATRNLGALRRRWTEVTHRSRRRCLPSSAARLEPGECVYVECGEDLYVICEGGSSILPLTRSQLQSQLRWIYFELSAAATDSAADDARIISLLENLRSQLFVRGTPRLIAPEGVFWTVPWQCLVTDSEVGVTLTPGRTATNSSTTFENVVVWYQADASLPHVESEVKELVERFPHAKVCRTIDEARNSLSGSKIDLLHVAAHGRHQADHPMLSTLGFEDGELTAAEISRSGGHVGVAVLTACHSGAMSSSNTFEPDGLSRAFLSLGASQVISGQWAIDDKTGLDWSREFYNCVDQGREVSRGVLRAREMIKLLRSHPYFWAPFVQFFGYNQDRSSM